MTVFLAPSPLYETRFALTPRRTVSEVRHIYSGRESRIDYGGEWWELEITTGVLPFEQAAAVRAWCDLLGDDDAIARVPLTHIQTPFGTTAATSVVVSSAASALSRSVTVSGLGANATLLAGSYLSTPGYNLHRLRQSVTANGAGAATLELFPRLRSALSVSAVLTLSGASAPSGLFRLQSPPTQAISRNVPPGYEEGVALRFVEAL